MLIQVVTKKMFKAALENKFHDEELDVLFDHLEQASADNIQDAGLAGAYRFNAFDIYDLWTSYTLEELEEIYPDECFDDLLDACEHVDGLIVNHDNGPTVLCNDLNMPRVYAID